LGLFKNMKDAMGQANEGMAGANQIKQQAEQQAGGISAGPGGMGAAFGAQGSLHEQAHEQNRILTVGSPGNALIKGHVDTGENVAGNPVWVSCRIDPADPQKIAFGEKPFM
jgi:hypothetical protein